ncbi:MAG TPA: helix-turn-helix transcriptional regulator [Terriglobia bacterium]|nr:helix-turn-helix transcriptional regulator [Terriglobia bacterium]
MHIGKRLKMLREAKGLSQGDIERGSGLLRSYVSRVEGGYTAPSLVTLDKFAKALGVEAYQLLFENHGQAPRPALIPNQANMTKSLKRLIKMYQGMPSDDRRLLLALAAKLAKE